MFCSSAKTYKIEFDMTTALSGSVVGFSPAAFGNYGSANPIPTTIHLSPTIVSYSQNTSIGLITLTANGDFVDDDKKFDLYVDGVLIGTSNRNAVASAYEFHQMSAPLNTFVAGNTYRIEFRNFRSA